MISPFLKSILSFLELKFYVKLSSLSCIPLLGDFENYSDSLDLQILEKVLKYDKKCAVMPLKR